MLKNIACLTIASMCLIPSAFAMTDSELGTAMRKDISKYMITLKSPKLIFHWVDASDVTPQGQYNNKFPSTSPQFKAYVEKQGKKVYNKRSSGDRDIEGPGMYMASDPFISRSYGGGKSFGLVVGLIKPGARILGSFGSWAIDPTIAGEISKRGCSAYGYDDIIDTYDATCNKVKQLMVGKDASFAEGRLYNWGSENVAGCRSRNPKRDLSGSASVLNNMGSQETFVVYNPNLFSDIYGYTHKTGVSGNSLADQIQSYLKGLQKTGARSDLVSDEQMKDAAIKPMAPAEIAKFSQQYILGCIP